MRAAVLVGLAVLVAAPVARAGDSPATLKGALAALVDGLAGDTEERAVPVFLRSVRYGDTEVGLASSYVEDRLREAFAAHPGFRSLAPDEVQALIDEVKKGDPKVDVDYAGLFDMTDAPRIGGLLKIRLYVDARCYELDEAFEVRLRVTDVETREERTAFSDPVSMGSLPKGARRLAPGNIEAVDLAVDGFKLPPREGQRSFRLTLVPDRGPGARYRKGEHPYFTLRAERACHLRLFHVSVDGALTLLYPNGHDPDDRIEEGRTYRIGDASYPFQFTAGAPYGAELVKAIAQTEPFTDEVALRERIEKEAEGELLALGDAAGAPEIRSRGLVFTRENLVAEAQTVIVVGE